ncbi:MFS transporter [Psychromonas aquimarina]|uniref:MFS transporter n=1 Tax=Psychromonas aquimarina TaxID=444919 RepID=UPI0004063C77|nr:MFS transporter [Psychromonas aquimarina]
MIKLHSSSYKRVTVGLGLGSFLVFCNLYYFQPLLPHFMRTFNATEIQVNWLFSVTTLAVAIALIPWAILSETYGRRPVMLCSLLLIPVINLLMFFSQDLSTLLVLRFFLGISLAGFIAVAVAYMADEFEPQALLTAVGGYISANSLGGILGRIYGGVMTDFIGLNWTILSMSALSFTALFFIFPRISRQDHFSAHKGRFFHHNRQLLTHIRTPKILLATIIGGLNFAMFINIYTVMAFKLSSPPLSLPASITSLIFLCYLAGTLSAKLSGSWTKKYSTTSGILAAAAVCFSAIIIMSLQNLVSIVLGLLLLSGGAFFIHSLAYGFVGRNARHGKSTATALYLVMYYCGGSLGGFVLISCWQSGGWPMVFTACVFTYLIMAALTVYLSRKSMPANTQCA